MHEYPITVEGRGQPVSHWTPGPEGATLRTDDLARPAEWWQHYLPLPLLRQMLAECERVEAEAMAAGYIECPQWSRVPA